MVFKMLQFPFNSGLLLCLPFLPLFIFDSALLPTCQFKITLPDPLRYKIPQLSSFVFSEFFGPFQWDNQLFLHARSFIKGSGSALDVIGGFIPRAFNHDISRSSTTLSWHGDNCSPEAMRLSREVTFAFVLHGCNISFSNNVG